MLAAFLTTIFFSLSVIFAARSARLLGGMPANFARMLLALCFLALWAHAAGQGTEGPALGWFLLSGCVGFGLGDIALFLAITRIGPRLTILLAQCLAAPFGAIAERVWLGTRLAPAEIACALVILAGVALAVAPRKAPERVEGLWVGVLFGVLAGLGQALGAVTSRKAYAVAEEAAFSMDGGTAAYQRMLGGIVVTGGFYVALSVWRRWRPAEKIPAAGRWRAAWPWVALNAIAGPAIGVGCYQWALSSTPSGIVLPIVAATPVVTMPLAFLIDGDRPSRRAVIGGLLAVGGAVALALA